MEFDFEEGINGPLQTDGLPTDRQLLPQHSGESRAIGFPDITADLTTVPSDSARPFDISAQFNQQQQPQQQQQQLQQQQQPQQIGPSIQALREAREAGGQVYLANLTWWTTDADVEAVCGTFGPVSGLQFVEDRSNGRSRGAVLVEFTEPEAAARCKEQLSGKPINGRSCIVTFAASANGKAGSTHRTTGGPGGIPGMDGRSGGRGGYGGRTTRGGGRGSRGSDRDRDRSDRDRGAAGGGAFGGGGGMPPPPDLPPPLGMPPMGPGMGPMSGMPHPHHGGGPAFLGAMAAAAGPLGLLPAMMGGVGVGLGGPLGPLGGGHPGMGPHGHPMGGPGGHFMGDM